MPFHGPLVALKWSLKRVAAVARSNAMQGLLIGGGVNAPYAGALAREGGVPKGQALRGFMSFG